MVDVALVTSSFLPRFGGVEEHVLNLARGLHGRGHRVVVWAVDRGDDDVPPSVDGIPVRYLPCPLPARTLQASATFARVGIRAWARWRRALRADRPQLIHVHCFGPNGIYARALARTSRLPLIVSSHGETFGDADGAFDQSALLRRSLRSSIREAAVVTGCSKYTTDDLVARFGADPDGIATVPNGIDLAEPSAPRPDWLPRNYVLGIGRLVHNKGFDLLVDAFARGRDRGLSLVIGGDGPEREPLRRQADALGLGDRLVLPGRLARPEVAAVMAHAKVLVVPSRAEAFGIAVLEGWRAGVPVIATRHGGPPEFITDGESGLIVDPTDVAALTRAIDRVASDDDLAGALGTTGRRRVTDFSWPSVTRRYESLYEQVLG